MSPYGIAFRRSRGASCPIRLPQYRLRLAGHDEDRDDHHHYGGHGGWGHHDGSVLPLGGSFLGSESLDSNPMFAPSDGHAFAFEGARRSFLLLLSLLPLGNLTILGASEGLASDK
jgi:hypothetical protein